MNRIRKISSFILALALCICFTVPAAAATVRVDNAAKGETYNAYKVFDATYALVCVESDPGHAHTSGCYAASYTISSGSAFWDVVWEASNLGSGSPAQIFKLTAVPGSTGTFTVELEEGKGAEDIVKVLKSADLTGVTPDGRGEYISATGQSVIEGLDTGYYFITTSLGSLVMIDTTTPDVTVTEKNGRPTLVKSADRESYDNGGIIKYTIKVTNIQGTNNLVLHDQMDEELTLKTGDAGGYSVTVTLHSDENDTEGKALVYGENFTIKVITDDDLCSETPDGHTGEPNECTFEVMFFDSLFENCSSEAYLHIVYNCEVNTEGDEYIEDMEDLHNVAHMSYGTASHSADVTVKVDLFGFEILKYTGESIPLAGASFELKDNQGRTAYFLDEKGLGISLLEGWYDPAESEVPDGFNTMIVSGDDGKILIEGLAAGTYMLTETEAPQGYNRLADTVTVVIGNDGSVSYKMTSSTEDFNETDNKIVMIENNAGHVLPGTGGMGTVIFYAAGIILMGGAALILFVRKYRNRAA